MDGDLRATLMSSILMARADVENSFPKYEYSITVIPGSRYRLRLLSAGWRAPTLKLALRLTSVFFLSLLSTMKILPTFQLVLSSLLIRQGSSFSLLHSPYQKRSHYLTSTSLCASNNISRRHALVNTILVGCSLMVGSAPSLADDTDLTSTLFNPDGSLKADMETEAKFRPVEFTWDVSSDDSDATLLNVDGKNSAGTPEGSKVKIGYMLPEKWATGKGSDEIYFDRSEGVNARACERITVYQAANKASMDVLDKATTIGVAKALKVPDDFKKLVSADLVSGRTSKRDGQRYFEFDMAVAPASCGSSKEDLGLGFCPYDSIFLLSATVLNDRMYVLVIESDKSEWKRANADLKRVRSSFSVGVA